MIGKLRQRFIVIASIALVLVIFLVIVSVNSISYVSARSDIYHMLDFLVENNGRMHPENLKHDNVKFHVTPETAYETRYFNVILDANDTIVMTDYDHIAAVTASDINVFYDAAIDDKDGEGSFETDDGIYYFKTKYISGDELNKTYSELRGDDINFNDETQYKLIVFMDCTNVIYKVRRLLFYTRLAGVMSFLIFFALVSILSKRAIRPTIENYEKQKQFITNAGHELKTPLAIISANAEVIEAIDGKSEWTQSIRNQVSRLNDLVKELIILSRLDEYTETENMERETIDFSAKVKETALSFAPVAEGQGKIIECDIEDGIKISCNGKIIQELVNILIDNAAKYCDENGTVAVELKKIRKSAVLKVKNTFKEGAETNFDKFFDRFYRGDTSHNRDKAEGYGIGLSMAERIVNLHKGKISAAYDNGNAVFTVIFAAE